MLQIKVRFILERGYSNWALVWPDILERDGVAYAEWRNGQKAEIRLEDEGKLWERKRLLMDWEEAEQILGKQSVEALRLIVRDLGVINDLNLSADDSKRLNAAITLLQVEK